MKLPNPNQIETVIPKDTQTVAKFNVGNTDVGLGDTLLKIGEQRRAAKNESEYNKALKYFNEAKGDLDNAYKKDMDWENMEDTYAEEIDGVLNNALSFISDGRIRDKFDADKSLHIAAGKTKIAERSLAIEGDQMRGQFQDTLEKTSDRIASSDDAVDMAEATREVSMGYDQLVNRGFAKADGKQDFIDEWVKGTVTKRLQMMESREVLEFLNDPSNADFLDGINVKQYKKQAKVDVMKEDAQIYVQKYFDENESNKMTFRSDFYEKNSKIKDTEKARYQAEAFENMNAVRAANQAETDSFAVAKAIDWFEDPENDNIAFESFEKNHPEIWGSMSEGVRAQVRQKYNNAQRISDNRMYRAEMDRMFYAIAGGDYSEYDKFMRELNGAVSDDGTFTPPAAIHLLSLDTIEKYRQGIVGIKNKTAKDKPQPDIGSTDAQAVERIMWRPTSGLDMDGQSNKVAGRMEKAVLGEYEAWKLRYAQENDNRLPNDSEREGAINGIIQNFDEKQLFRYDMDDLKDEVNDVWEGTFGDSKPEKLEKVKQFITEELLKDPVLKEQLVAYEVSGDDISKLEIYQLLDDPYYKTRTISAINEAVKRRDEWWNTEGKQQASGMFFR